MAMLADHPILTDATTGYPSINPSITGTLTYNVDTVLVEESFKRLYPVIHDTNNLFSGGSTGWNVEMLKC